MKPGTVVHRIIHFFSHDIWRINKKDISFPWSIGLKPLRVVVMTVRGYIQDNCALQASALTFYTLLSIVPVVAMAFGVAKGFGLEQRLEKQLYLRLAGQEEVVAKIIDFARSLLENTKGGLIAGIGVAVLFWSAIKVLSNIENAFNHIWKVNGRSFIRKFSDYLSIMIISPLLVVISSSVNVFITTEVTAMTGKLALLHAASPVIVILLKLLPFGLIWLLFFVIYMVMPNTQIRFASAIIAGISAGTFFQIIQGFYIHAQVLVSRYNAIYGSFAALPLFLIWLQLSWMVVLLGAEIAYSHQHVGHFAMASDYRKSSMDVRRRLALHILRRIFEGFKEGKPPITAHQISQSLEIPDLMVARLMEELLESGLVTAVVGKKNNGPPAYQPSRDIHRITIADVLDALDKRGTISQPEQQDDNFKRLCQAVDKIQAEIHDSPHNKLLIEI